MLVYVKLIDENGGVLRIGQGVKDRPLFQWSLYR